MSIFFNLILTVALSLLGGFVIYQFHITTTPPLAFLFGGICVGVILSLLNRFKGSSSSVNTSSKTIYVGNLPYRANEHDVKELFSEFGEVFAVRLMMDKRTGKRRGFGFVVMDHANADDAITSLNNCEYGDRTLKVREANDPKKGELE